MLDFVCSENREYQGKILTELVDIPDCHSVKLNVVFFYKSNWQNELVRLARRNKFMCALMENVNAVGIESPNMRWPGQRPGAPVYLHAVQADQVGLSVVDRRDGGDPNAGGTGGVTSVMQHFPAMATGGDSEGQGPSNPSNTTTAAFPHSILRNPSITPSHTRTRPAYHDTISSATTINSPLQSRKIDFSLGVCSTSNFLADDSFEIFEDRKRQKNPGMLSPAALDRVREEAEEGDHDKNPSWSPHLAISTGVDVSRTTTPTSPGGGVSRRAGSVLHRWGSRASRTRRDSAGSADSQHVPGIGAGSSSNSGSGGGGGGGASGNRFFGRLVPEEVAAGVIRVGGGGSSGDNIEALPDLECGRGVVAVEARET